VSGEYEFEGKRKEDVVVCFKYYPNICLKRPKKN